jgi:hypothetical protein
VSGSVSVAPLLTGGSGFVDRWPNADDRTLIVEARAHASTDPAALWALLEDADRHKAWGPWSGRGYVEQPTTSPHGAGAMRRLRHRATVRLTPDHRGSEIRWRATFDRTLRGRLVRRTLQRIYREVADQLVTAAETTAQLAASSDIHRHPWRQ